jgi:hypothetical protein
MTNSGITIDVPEAAAAPAVPEREVPLPSGAVATIRPGKGKDIRLALMAVGTPFDAGRYRFALLARKVKIGGKQLTMEQMDELSEDDVEALMVEASGQSPSPLTAGGSA